MSNRGRGGSHEGILEPLEGGDGLVRTSDRRPPFLVPRRDLHGAIAGDLVRVEARSRRPSAPGALPRAAVVAVLERRHDTLVGSVERDDEGRWWLLPFASKVPLTVELTAGVEGTGHGEFVVARLDRRGRDAGVATGRVVERLGPVERPGVDVLVVLRHFGIPEEWPQRVLLEAAALPADPAAADIAEREDLRQQVTVTIDGASARDFDDAISVERVSSRLFRVGVHIADVSHYVPPGGGLDGEAYRRGTSVYYPERAIPMLPERLSTELCSLRPGVPRLAVSVFLDVDRQGRVQARRFATTVIRSHRRLTYDEVRRVLEEPRAGDEREYGPVLAMLRQAREVMQALHLRRTERGSLDFDLPEGDVELDTDGYVVGIRPGQRHVAHRLIEELMIAANEAVAEELLERQQPALFRVHHPPDPERVDELRTLLRPFGIDLPESSEPPEPGALQDVLRRVEGRPEEPFVAAVVLRSQQRAIYHPDSAGHYALASEHYLHFTSPIRRYPDLVAHRQLKALLAEGQAAKGVGGRGRRRDLGPLDPAPPLAQRLPEMAEHTSATERRAEQSERELLQWKKVRFLADRVGDRFAGRITGVQPFGLFVQLTELFVDGLVPVATLGDDYFVHDPAGHRLVGSRSGRSFRLAQEVEVELVGVSTRHRSLDLQVVATERDGTRESGREQRRAEAGPKKGRRRPAGRGRRRR
ncbi:MAG TPA: ribonuclease R [Thermoanaerobaculia bacterium]|nr:ribonuclease R [Thermoanaerobaculia bacterium]